MASFIKSTVFKQSVLSAIKKSPDREQLAVPSTAKNLSAVRTAPTILLITPATYEQLDGLPPLYFRTCRPNKSSHVTLE